MCLIHGIKLGTKALSLLAYGIKFFYSLLKAPTLFANFQIIIFRKKTCLKTFLDLSKNIFDHIDIMFSFA